jgi:hypothetical protein
MATAKGDSPRVPGFAGCQAARCVPDEIRQLAECPLSLIVVNKPGFESGLNERQRMTGVPNNRRNDMPAASPSMQPSPVAHRMFVPHSRSLHESPASAKRCGYVRERWA